MIKQLNAQTNEKLTNLKTMLKLWMRSSFEFEVVYLQTLLDCWWCLMTPITRRNLYTVAVYHYVIVGTLPTVGSRLRFPLPHAFINLFVRWHKLVTFRGKYGSSLLLWLQYSWCDLVDCCVNLVIYTSVLTIAMTLFNMPPHFRRLDFIFTNAWRYNWISERSKRCPFT